MQRNSSEINSNIITALMELLFFRLEKNTADIIPETVDSINIF